MGTLCHNFYIDKSSTVHQHIRSTSDCEMARFSKESICEICGFLKIQGKDREFSEHVRKHFKDSFDCDLCTTSFQTIRQRTEHKRRAHCPSVACDVCGKTFANINNMVKHKRSAHLKELMQFLCTTCDKQFAYRDKYERHIISVSYTHLTLPTKRIV